MSKAVHWYRRLSSASFWRSWRWPVLAAWLSLFSLGLIDNSRGPVFPEILEEFRLSDTAGSFFFLIASMASLIHNTIFYRFLSRANPKRLIGIYTLTMAGGALLIANSGTYPGVLVACAILGIGFGGLGVGQNSAVQEAPPEHRQRAMGLLHSMYGVSSFTAPILISAFLAFGWRLSIAFLSLPAVIVGLFVIVEAARHQRRQKVTKVQPSHNGDMTPTIGALSTHPQFVRFAPWAAAFVLALLVISEISVSTRLTLLVRREWGFSTERASAMLAFYFAAMTVSRLGIGFFKIPIAAKSLLYSAMFVGLPLLVLAFMPLGFSSETRTLFLVCFGFPIAMGYPLAMTRVAEIFGERKQRVTSLCLILQSGGAMCMHYSLGWGADSLGLLFSLGAVSIVSLLGALVAFWRLERLASL